MKNKLKKIQLRYDLHELGKVFIKHVESAVLASGIDDFEMVVEVITQELDSMKDSFESAIKIVKDNDHENSKRKSL